VRFGFPIFPVDKKHADAYDACSGSFTFKPEAKQAAPSL
jgi:hypothetical protein